MFKFIEKLLDNFGWEWTEVSFTEPEVPAGDVDAWEIDYFYLVHIAEDAEEVPEQYRGWWFHPTESDFYEEYMRLVTYRLKRRPVMIELFDAEAGCGSWTASRFENLTIAVIELEGWTYMAFKVTDKQVIDLIRYVDEDGGDPQAKSVLCYLIGLVTTT